MPKDLSQLWEKQDDQQDQQKENTMICHQDFLLYEETSHGMNYRDIGHVEQCMVPWMGLFMGVGKAKYVMEMRRYLENIHIHFPKPLV